MAEPPSPAVTVDADSVIERCAALCDERASHWRKNAHDARGEDEVRIALGMWTGFESAASHIRTLKSEFPSLSQEGWRDIASAPKDGTPITAARTVRYLPYKPDGRRQMQTDGRWQEWNGYGWRNCEGDPGKWLPPPPSVTESPNG